MLILSKKKIKGQVSNEKHRLFHSLPWENRNKTTKSNKNAN